MDSPEEATKRLEILWQEHLFARFPPNLLGVSINGGDLVLLDSSLVGCISVYMKTGALDLWRTSLIGLNYREAFDIARVLDKEGAKYFWRLGKMGEIVLRLIVENERESQQQRERSS
ncbi:MAG: hypothetical protein OHK0029_05630 [Armatimonadaceae bacterium]